MHSITLVKQEQLCLTGSDTVVCAARKASEIDEEIGFVGSIPVRNLWLLMLYASDLYRDRDLAKVSVEDNPEQIADLVAEVLCQRVERRILRMLSFGYRSREAVLSRVRGRIDLLKTETQRLIDRGKVACNFHELTVDTTRNRFVRAALEKISGVVRTSSLARRCRRLAANMLRMGVTGKQPSRNEVAIDRFGLHDLADRPMVVAAQLAFNLALPTEISGAMQLSSPERQIEWVRKLFEKGIAGFYDVVLSPRGWGVTAGRWIHWQIDYQSQGVDRVLPSMQTDIILVHANTERRIVIDTKFDSVLTTGWHRDETIRSKYLYQIYAYLRSQEGSGEPFSDYASGLLLHPSIGSNFDERVVIQNHEIRFATVDLGASSAEIRNRLLGLVLTT